MCIFHKLRAGGKLSVDDSCACAGHRITQYAFYLKTLSLTDVQILLDPGASELHQTLRRTPELVKDSYDVDSLSRGIYMHVRHGAVDLVLAKVIEHEGVLKCGAEADSQNFTFFHELSLLMTSSRQGAVPMTRGLGNFSLLMTRSSS